LPFPLGLRSFNTHESGSNRPRCLQSVYVLTTTVAFDSFNALVRIASAGAGPKGLEVQTMSGISKRLGRLREVIARTEHHVAAQRARVQQAHSQQNRREAGKALALLGLMEKVAEEYRAIRAILQAHPGLKPDQTTRPLADALPRSKSMSCPHCGLVARCFDEGGSWALEYTYAEWAARCQHRHLGSAALCQLQRFGVAGTVH
jgi:hypothetical protein